MRLYLDDNLTDRRVVAQLHRAGHTVVLPADIGHAGRMPTTSPRQSVMW